MQRKTIAFLSVLFVVFSAMLTFSVAAGANDFDLNELSKGDWIKIESDNFLVVSAHGKNRSTAIVQDLEEYHYFLKHHLGLSQKPLTNKITVIITKEHDDFRLLGWDSLVAGIYFSEDDEHIFFASGDDYKTAESGIANAGRRIIFHELAHVAMFNNETSFRLPYWYREGMAEFFGSYIRKRGDIKIGDLRGYGSRLDSIKISGSQRYGIMDVATLLTMEPRDLLSDRDILRFYANAFAVYHYISSSEELQKQTALFLSLLANDYDLDAAFPHAYQTSYEDFRQSVEGYINSRLVVAWTLPVGKKGIVLPDFAMSTTPLSGLEAVKFIYERRKLRLSPTQQVAAEEQLKQLSETP